jgi:hypothetical protein
MWAEKAVPTHEVFLLLGNKIKSNQLSGYNTCFIQGAFWSSSAPPDKCWNMALKLPMIM